MAERDAREAHGDLRVARAADQEAGPAGVIVGAADADLVRQQRDLVEQARQLGRLCAVVERRKQFDRFTKVREKTLKLLLQIGVENGESSCQSGGKESRGRAEERRVGKECVSKCRSGWTPEHKK